LPIGVVLQTREAAFLPAQRHRVASQRQLRRDSALQRRHVVELVARELRAEPVRVFGDEAIASRQAAAQRQGQPRASFIDSQFQSARARVAHALQDDRAPIGQLQIQRLALDRAWLGCQQTEQGWHGRLGGGTNATRTHPWGMGES
jgi:hypothetical protein